MPDNKLTDNEALIAFKNCCLTEDCDNCIAIKKVGNKYDCVLEPSDIVRAFDCLQAENERLKTNREHSKLIIQRLKEKILVAKAEAYKECIEKTKERLSTCVTDTQQMVFELRLDNLLKELVGDK